MVQESQGGEPGWRHRIKEGREKRREGGREVRMETGREDEGARAGRTQSVREPPPPLYITQLGPDDHHGGLDAEGVQHKRALHLPGRRGGCSI